MDGSNICSSPKQICDFQCNSARGKILMVQRQLLPFQFHSLCKSSPPVPSPKAFPNFTFSFLFIQFVTQFVFHLPQPPSSFLPTSLDSSSSMVICIFENLRSLSYTESPKRKSYGAFKTVNLLNQYALLALWKSL